MSRNTAAGVQIRHTGRLGERPAERERKLFPLEPLEAAVSL